MTRSPFKNVIAGTVFAILMALSADVGADELSPRPALVETQNTMKMVARDCIVWATVTRAFHNTGSTQIDGTIHLEMPPETVITDLRTDANRTARMEQGFDDGVIIFLPEISPNETRTVRFVARFPLIRDDRRGWFFPAEVAPDTGLSEIEVYSGDRMLEPAIFAGKRGFRTRCILENPGIFRFGTARHGAHTLVLAEVVTPRFLVPAANPSPVMFVFDASTSMGERGLREQFGIARAYVKDFQTARYNAVIAGATAWLLGNEFTDAVTFDAVLQGMIDDPIQLHSGGALTLGLRKAVEVLGPSKEATRVLAFTDGGVEPEFNPDEMITELRHLPHGSAIHVLVVDPVSREGTPIQHRDDEHPLAKLAMWSGGILLRITTPESDAFRYEEAILNLVKPRLIENVRILIDDVVAGTWERLGSGRGISGFAITRKAPEKAEVTSKMWAMPRSWTLEYDTAVGDRTAWRAIGSQTVRSALNPDENMALARRFGALGPWSDLVASGDKTVWVARKDRATPIQQGTQTDLGGILAQGPVTISPELFAFFSAEKITACREHFKTATVSTVSVSLSFNEIIGIDASSDNPDLAGCLEAGLIDQVLPREMFNDPLAITTLVFLGRRSSDF